MHFGDGFVHEIFAGDVEGVGEMVDLLVGEQVAINLGFDDCGCPVDCPVYVAGGLGLILLGGSAVLDVCYCWG